VSLVIVHAVLAVVWRERFCLDGERPSPGEAGPSLDRLGLAKAVAATGVLLLLFTTPLPQTEGVLAIAGWLMVSRRLATKRLLGLVDWHLLVLFAGLFVVTAAPGDTGLPARAVASLAAAGLPLGDLAVLAPLTVVGSSTIGNVPLDGLGRARDGRVLRAEGGRPTDWRRPS